jgi:hypothetical protein
MSNVWGMICHAWNAVTTSNSVPKVPTHANCIWPCHIATLVWRNPHTRVLRQEFGPPKSASWWLEFTTQLDPRTNCASFAFRCWAIKGQAEETWWGPVAMPTLISMFKSPWNFVFTSATSVYSLEVPNGKYRKVYSFWTARRMAPQQIYVDYRWISLHFTAFHRTRPCLKPTLLVAASPQQPPSPTSEMPPAVRKLSNRLGHRIGPVMWVKQ